MLGGNTLQAQQSTAEPLYRPSHSTPTRPNADYSGIPTPAPAGASRSATSATSSLSSSSSTPSHSGPQPAKVSSAAASTPGGLQQQSRPPSAAQAHGGLSTAPSFASQHPVPRSVPIAEDPLLQHSSRPSPVAPGSGASTSSPASGRGAPQRGDATPSTPRRIKVRDLSHIESFASEEFLLQSRSAHGAWQGSDEVGLQYEISAMPVTDIIEMVAGLLTKITSTNDRQHEHLHRHIPPAEGTSGLSQQSSSVLAFHGKNIPSITILSYLTRIHKYCPTTYEVFLSLLVYFDRMTERVNTAPLRSLAQTKAAQQSTEHLGPRDEIASPAEAGTPAGTASVPPPPPPPTTIPSGGAAAAAAAAAAATPPSSGHLAAQERADAPSPSIPPGPTPPADPYNLSHFFVVDSYNIHRLVIAGVTCASKFFSDVFYTNSRYAKVGGLPLVELNHLELQFLVLNEFRLSIPVETLDAYGTMLVEFYAREIMEQRLGDQAMEIQSPTPP
ncbi:cyclin-domain-containing protein [Xylona heveae TC161]|uniref:Cyclin-domain-containing protein n=1 Tax=Xylona heveae (strain CBS 132557 / TC161) TaxID=1328760 RepID=A0A165JYC6_XYLHT|nr:cyclin-domain-containing protein [Xylona heveae TC161]KZF26781.1 cyclin-domain-containing protein [Xylona heveae TC161]